MKIAVLGTGKTGGKVIDEAEARGHEVFAFNSKKQPTSHELKELDVIICFLNGKVLETYINEIIASGIPAVIGATGSDWKAGLDEKLKEAGLTWIYAPNFAATMPKIKKIVEILSEIEADAQPHLEETHHVDKVDSPSGTALAWEEWLGKKVTFTDYREADTFGIHKLTIETENETVSIEHTAKDRSAFALGAVRAAENLCNTQTEPGLESLYDIGGENEED